MFVTNAVIRRLNNQYYDFRGYPRIKELFKASKEAEVPVYYFSIPDFDYINKKIRGTYFDERSLTWKKRIFPLPDVLYTRRGAPGRSGMMVEFIERSLAHLNTVNINAKSFFDKWDVYDKLQQIPAARKYLPPTRFYKDPQDLLNFLNDFDTVYLKGIRGGRGRWIFRVRKLAQGGYEYSYFVNEVTVGRVQHFRDLVRVVRRFFKKRKFVIQAGIDLIKLEDSNIDFRAELQRDGEGKLTILGVSARIAHKGAPITIHSDAYPIEQFLREFLHYSDQQILEYKEKITRFLGIMYIALERVYGTFGEIGIDFGIDKSGEIWFIEPNSRSAKVSLMKAYDADTFYQAFLNPLKFAKYLHFNKSKSNRGERDDATEVLYQYREDTGFNRRGKTSTKKSH
ncbi:YheC/YheD family protein [Ammoniphilus sp. CFH 90114]|uniref:YheC/YheD family endospore coat-associated protein n=1 Tax=Ammoniphilus sp. CFH 90114 TaxID=2493665 RepID=UPI0013E99539|nr:YheC/YheD family protein [Ammoniphilus sp. CFH 90114]